MARAKTKKQAKVAEVKKRAERRTTGRANYGATENGRICRKCGHEDSSIESMWETGRMIVRYRICCKCGARRTTQQIANA